MVGVNVAKVMSMIEDVLPVPPSVSQDGDGAAILYWVAGGLSVEIDVDGSGIVYGDVTDGDRIDATDDPGQVIAQARAMLARISQARGRRLAKPVR